MAAVRQVVKVKLLPTPEQALALAAALRTCNEAVSWLSEQMHRDRVWRRLDARKR